jgi:citrate lyase gamma subunit
MLKCTNFRKIAFLLGILITGIELNPAWAGTPVRSVPKPAFGITFAQVSSAVDQQPGNNVQFESSDGVKRMDVTKNSVIVKEAGSYLIIASPQVTALKDNGCIDVWMIVNNKDVPNSGVRACQSKAGNTDVVVSQGVFDLKKGDIIQIKTNGKGVMLDAIKPEKGAAIPSIILTVLGLSTSSQ